MCVPAVGGDLAEVVARAEEGVVVPFLDDWVGRRRIGGRSETISLGNMMQSLAYALHVYSQYYPYLSRRRVLHQVA
jgi:hypothetical protein